MSDSSPDSSRKPDPLDRDVPAASVPLRSPMPRSRVLDNEEPELGVGEEDIASDDKGVPPDRKREKGKTDARR